MARKTPKATRRADVLALLAEQRRALHVAEIASRLGIPPRAYAGLQRMLSDLSFDGVLTALSGQRYRVAKMGGRAGSAKSVEGYFHGHARGFGFVAGLEGDRDVFVPAESAGGAMHGDRVRVEVVAHTPRGPEGSVLAVIERGRARVGGTANRRGRTWILEPDDTRIRSPIPLAIPPELEAQIVDGYAVVATIDRFPETADELPEATLNVVLGKPGDIEVEVAKIIARRGHDAPFGQDALEQASQAQERGIDEERPRREDLTHLPLPTIDPQDARDHDDAVWAETQADGHTRVWVAIADVSHYVRPQSALDREALLRGTSVYLPDRALPMLPHGLTTDVCSLTPGDDRLCLCVEIDLDADAKPVRRRIFEGVMRSQAKLHYEGVARTLGLTAAHPVQPEAEELKEGLEVLWETAKSLRRRRSRRGSLMFDLPEAKVEFGDDELPKNIVRRTQDPGVAKAYQLVEEMMLLANEMIAEELTERRLPTIYRIHEAPDALKLERFAALCARRGVEFEPELVETPQKLSAFLRKLSTREDKDVLFMAFMRSMKQAAYDVRNKGHFGLASTHYLHFTSPIRRYPDIVVHRGVRTWLRADSDEAAVRALSSLEDSAKLASQREREAMEVEREVMDVYRAYVAKDRIGETFQARISAFVTTGMFVTIYDPFIDVMVPYESLGSDSYDVDDEGLAVVGRRSGERIELGDEIMIEIVDAAIARGSVLGRRVGGVDAGSHRKPERKGRRREGGRIAKARDDRSTRGRGSKGRGAPPSKSSSAREGKTSRKVRGSTKSRRTKR